MKPNQETRSKRKKLAPRAFAWVCMLLSTWPVPACKQNRPADPEPVGAPQPNPAMNSPIGHEGPVAQSRKQPATRELRGVWLSNVDSEALKSRENIFKAFQFLAESGFTTVYPVVWNRGYTLFPSQVTKRTFGAEVYPDRAFQGTTEKRDMLQECVEAGKKYQLEVIPWFEYGLKVPANHPLFRSRPDWFTQTQTGLKTRSAHDVSFGYLNLAQAEVRQFLLELITDVVTRYDIQGIQLDDHFSLWHEFGYDNRTLALFKQETGKSAPKVTQDKQWLQFRADLITAFLADLDQAIQAKRPAAIMSLSSNSYPWSLQNHLQDWPKWLQQNIADEFLLQNYHQDFTKYELEFANKTLMQAFEQSRSKNQIMVMGILAGLRTRLVSAAEIEQRVIKARSNGYGVAFFFYDSLLNFRPASESIENRKNTLLQLFAVPSAAR